MSLQPINRRVDGTCSMDYYQRAFQVMDEKLGKPCYYIFSDDPEWVKQNLVSDLNSYKIVQHNYGRIVGKI